MSDEPLSHYFELAAKSAWAVLVVVGLMLLTPEHLATELGFASIRSTNLGYLWILLVFSGTLVLGPHVKSFLWRFVLCPIKKLIFPAKDLRSQIEQSRMRYYLVRFTSVSCEPTTAYQEVDSNGNVRRYLYENGKRFVPPEIHSCSLVGDKGFKHPKWEHIDWHDIFNGDSKSGCFGITER